MGGEEVWWVVERFGGWWGGLVNGEEVWWVVGRSLVE